QSVARSEAQMNGIRQSEIVYNGPASDGRSITMVVERNVPYRFARLFGLSQSLVTVKAVAIAGPFHSATGLLPIGSTWKPLAMGGCKRCAVRATSCATRSTTLRSWIPLRGQSRRAVNHNTLISVHLNQGGTASLA